LWLSPTELQSGQTFAPPHPILDSVGSSNIWALFLLIVRGFLSAYWYTEIRAWVFLPVYVLHWSSVFWCVCSTVLCFAKSFALYKRVFVVCAPECYYLQTALRCKNVLVLYVLHSAITCKELCVVKTCFIVCAPQCYVVKTSFLVCMFHRATMGKGAVYYSVNISRSLPLSQKEGDMSPSLRKRQNVYKHIPLTWHTLRR
jgi:hypothetical protein